MKQYPADKLLNVSLESGWQIDQKLENKTDTSGKYSTCYLASKGERKGFLKAFDYRDLQKPGGQDQFSRVHRKFDRERQLLLECSQKNIMSVVQIIDSGEHFFIEGDVNERVDYFILEYSNDGNVRDCLENDSLTNLIYKFESLSDVFDGLHELHINGIVHLDLKPSNPGLFHS